MPAGRDPRAEPGSGSASGGGRERLRGGAGRALAAFLVGRCGGGQVLAGEGLASRRPGEPGTKRGSARGPWPPSSGAPSSEHIASSRTGGAAAAGSGAGGREPPHRPPRGVRPIVRRPRGSLGPRPPDRLCTPAGRRTGLVCHTKGSRAAPEHPDLTGFPFPPIC